ncbi:MAG: YihY family inner membrane protein [Alphaproteobacteria bacterium]
MDLERLPETARNALGFLVYALARFRGDRCLRIAASLSYTSLLAMVPLVAIGVAIMSAFPVFDSVRERFGSLLLTYVAPHAGEQVQSYFDTFVSNTGRLTAVGVIGLAVTAVLLLSTIEGAFNVIWRVDRPRPFVMRLIAYWTVLTLGPLLVGAGLSLSTYFFAIGNWVGITEEIGFLSVRVLPLLLAAAGFTVLYIGLPHRRVDWRSAIAGGLLAALLFELLKRVFGLYVARFAGFQAVYGALAALPAFLIWMYLTWSVVLLGAVVAAAWPEWRASQRSKALREVTPGRCFVRAIQVMAALLSAGRESRETREYELLEVVNGDSDGLVAAIGALRDAGYVAWTDRDTLVLARDLDGVSLYQVYRALGLGAAELDLEELSHVSWGEKLSRLVNDADLRDRDALGIPIKALFSEEKTAVLGSGRHSAAE